MKKIVMGLLAAVIMLTAIGCGSTSSNNETSTNATKETENTTESIDNDAKTLIVYYSYSGTTKRVAEHLQQLTDGTPVWNDSMSNPIASYLEQTDFEGKTVAPFWTYITNQGSTEKDFANQSQNAERADGLPVQSANGISDEKLDQMLETWLSDISGR